MKRSIRLLGFLIPLCIIIVGSPGYPQPKIPRENIPSKIPADVREKIDKLYSHDPKERALAAISLGEIGAGATGVIPFLLGLLDDNGYLVSAKYVKDLGYEVTTPGKEAALALAKMGNAKPAVESLITALRHKDKTVRTNASGALKEITGQDFGDDPLKWQKWWDQNKEQFLRRR
jgi:hypothetical protein